MIPSEKEAAVFRCLREAFGTAAIEEIRVMPKGLSSDLVYRIVVNGSPYLLKIVTRIGERSDPPREFQAMRAAADAGLSPRVWHASIEDGISITDFVATAPLAVPEALRRIPATLHRLHALPPFPKAFNYVTAHNGFIWRFRSADLLSRNQVEEVFSRYEQICAVYPRLDADMVSCHCDLKPENILFDGKSLWLVDWQAAFRNDRYFDLSIAANFVVTSAGDEQVYLQTYFGHPPDAYQLARFFLMRQVMRMFYATVFLLIATGGKPVDQSDPLPPFRDFHQQIWDGRVSLAGNEMRITYGRIHWEQLIQNVREVRFDEALRTVSDRHGRPVDAYRLLPAAP